MTWENIVLILIVAGAVIYAGIYLGRIIFNKKSTPSCPSCSEKKGAAAKIKDLIDQKKCH